ncbi:TadE family type IV pilus minor pilin [Saccharopolyspora griseoalba]|uniref:TadE family type IV pilus minor pilin n=1 Tax=Saccharopolyspora griseoalba TaxID=1431848 RepID=A0ABW2LI95_9PSEU
MPARLAPAPVGAGADRGSVTVEAALGICSLVVVFGLLLSGAGALFDQLRCQDAAVEAARLLARGDRERAGQAVRAIAPEGARLERAVDGDQVDVAVTAPLRLLPGRSLRAEATAVLEPGQRG